MDWVRNISPTSWLILLFCAFVNWFTLYVVSEMFGLANAELWALVVIVIIVAISLTPTAESILRFFHGGRLSRGEETEIISNSFQPVMERAKEAGDFKHRTPQFYVSDNLFPNAFAIGSNSIVITKKLVDIATAGELSAVIAHEMGHLKNGDSQVRLINAIINVVGSIAAKIGTVFITIIAFFTGIFSESSSSAFFVYLIGIVIVWVLRTIHWLLQRAINLGTLAVGRQAEYVADGYVKKLGYAPHMVSFLQKVAPMDIRTSGWVEALYRTHPEPGKRIEKLLEEEA